jgi:LacI family transcriptional regulator
MRETPRVALLVETARGYGRGLLRGIVRYARLHGPWAFYVTPGDFAQQLPRMRDWGGTGIVARIENDAVARAILEARLPTIALDLTEAQAAPGSPLAALPEVASDSRAAARMAADHLLGLGLRRFAFVGLPGRPWSDRREAAFIERIRDSGHEPLVYPGPRARGEASWEREQARLAEWIAALPPQTGLMACNDDRGRQVLEAARRAGVQVPEQLAVVGVDDDDLLCELADPPLSSVALDAEAGGYRTAALLDDMMRAPRRRRRGPPERLLVGPLHVVTRRSTDIVALDDPEVAEAVRFIQQHACDPVRAADVIEDRLLSRRSLEIRFRRAVGRSIHAEILRVRLERARRLLLETDWPIPRVAEIAGFGNPSYLAQLFRRAHRTTPARYRRDHKGQG